MQENNEIRSVSIIGAGNVAWHMALAMKKAGLEVFHIISRSAEASQEIATLVNAQTLMYGKKLDRIPDLILICVSDNAIEDILVIFRYSNTVLAHTAGNIPMDVLANNKTAYGVFYPLQTFTREQEMEYNDIPILVEGQTPAIENQLIALAKKVSGSYYTVDSRSRSKIHLAAVFACNFSNHMAAIASKLMKEEGLDNRLLMPLLDQTYTKLKTMDPRHAQTGPAMRDDQRVLEKHIELLKEHKPEQDIYKQLSENILRYKDKYE